MNQFPHFPKFTLMDENQLSHQSSQTSLNAYKEIKSNKTDVTQREAILIYMLERLRFGRHSLTMREISINLKMNIDSVKARCHELRVIGSLKSVGIRNKCMLLEAVIVPVPMVAPFKYSDKSVIQFVKLFVNLDEKYLLKKLAEFKANYK